MNGPSLFHAFFGATAIACCALAGCSSSDPAPATPTTDAADIPTDAGATGVFIDRDDACARYLAALQAKATALACDVRDKDGAPLSCPAAFDALEQKGGLAGKCVRYDEGSIAGCEARIASYTSCDDFAGKPCLFAVQQDPTGASCPPADAGPDGAIDAAADTAPVDAAADSATEAAVDAAGDADEAG